jgi:hypothetical protein
VQAEQRQKVSPKKVHDLKAALDEHAVVAIDNPQEKETECKRGESINRSHDFLPVLFG